MVQIGSITALLALIPLALFAAGCSDDNNNDTTTNPPTFTPDAIVSHDALQAALATARATDNGGFNLDMWGTVIDRDGVVVAVAYTGSAEGNQWPGSRVISAQKANTANSFSLPQLALSTANLYAATQPGGTLFGLQEANPTNDDVAYGGNTDDYGTTKDYMVGKRIGGTNVFGGGLALYTSDGTLVGALGVSGDASCADHNIAWKVRHILNLDNVPGGVADGGLDDNIIYDIDSAGVSAGGFGHPTCFAASTSIGVGLPTTYPIGPNQ